MTKVMRKISILMLVIAMAITMMPLAAFADDAAAGGQNYALKILFCGQESNLCSGLTTEWMEQNKMDPQVFPFAGDKGNKWGYVIAEGPSFESVTSEVTKNMANLDDFTNTQLIWRKDAAEFKTPMKVSDLLKQRSQFALRDQNGNIITGAFTDASITSAEAIPIAGAQAVTPIIAVRSTGIYDTYDEAMAALADGSWKSKAKEAVSPFVGGDLSADTFLKKDGVVNAGTINFTGKFNAKDRNELNFDVVVPQESTSGSLTIKTNDFLEVPSDIGTDLSIYEVLFLSTFKGLVWSSDNEEVAKVDELGFITPGKNGTCTVTASFFEGKVLGTCSVTVKILKPVTIKVSPLSKAYKAKDLKKKAKSFQLKATVTSKAKASFKKVSGSNKLTVSKSGKVTVKKGTKKGTYTAKVRVSVPAKGNYKAGSKDVTIKVIVKK